MFPLRYHWFVQRNFFKNAWTIMRDTEEPTPPIVYDGKLEGIVLKISQLQIWTYTKQEY